MSEDIKDKVEVFPEYIYMTIPSDYVCIYHKLVMYMADFGKEIISDCTTTCKDNAKNLISCWNLFLSSFAAYNLNKKKEAQFYIDYIEKQLDLIYKGVSNKAVPVSLPVKITDDGRLQAIVSCDNGIRFYVDYESGNLYQEYLEEKGQDQKYHIASDDLIYENSNFNK